MEALNKRSILCVYKDNEENDFIGAFLNARHIESFLGIHNSNIIKYLKCKINDISGYIVVQVNIENNPINFSQLKNIGMEQVLIRKNKNKLLRLNNESILKLSNESINKIIEIIDEKQTD